MLTTKFFNTKSCYCENYRYGQKSNIYYYVLQGEGVIHENAIRLSLHAATNLEERTKLIDDNVAIHLIITITPKFASIAQFMRIRASK